MSCRLFSGPSPIRTKQEGCGVEGFLPKVLRVVEDRQSDWAWGTVEFTNIRADTLTHSLLSEQQVSPQTNALQNDRITRESQENKNKKETKVCTGRRWSTFCITVFFWYTEIDAQRKGTSRDKEDTSHNWQDCDHIPMISSNLSIRRLNTDSSIRLIYTWYFNFSLGAAMKLAYIPNIWGIKKITKKPGEIIRLFWLVS